MLRITRDDADASDVRLALEGRLVGDWLDVLRSELACAGNAANVVLDLARVSFASPEGVAILRSARAAGARLIGCSPLLTILLEGHES